MQKIEIGLFCMAERGHCVQIIAVSLLAFPGGVSRYITFFLAAYSVGSHQASGLLILHLLTMPTSGLQRCHFIPLHRATPTSSAGTKPSEAPGISTVNGAKHAHRPASTAPRHPAPQHSISSTAPPLAAQWILQHRKANKNRQCSTHPSPRPVTTPPPRPPPRIPRVPNPATAGVTHHEPPLPPQNHVAAGLRTVDMSLGLMHRLLGASPDVSPAALAAIALGPAAATEVFGAASGACYNRGDGAFRDAAVPAVRSGAGGRRVYRTGVRRGVLPVRWEGTTE
ncbi:hypothetical protein DFP73DRAFT_621499 [Morchella snyderi]|nr:hypothetical protein DFP73DRAFT_621499 [Morchella snyderi]